MKCDCVEFEDEEGKGYEYYCDFCLATKDNFCVCSTLEENYKCEIMKVRFKFCCLRIAHKMDTTKPTEKSTEKSKQE